MYKVGEGTRGVDVVAVFNGVSEMKEFIKKNSLTERGKYILLEVSSIGETVRDVLNNLGMNGLFLGSDYLHDAIELALNDDAYINLITKVTYPELAKKYNVSYSCIEREQYVQLLRIHGKMETSNIVRRYLGNPVKKVVQDLLT